MQAKNHLDLTTLFQKEHQDFSKFDKTAEIVVELTESTSECYTEIDYELEFAEKTENKHGENVRKNSILNNFNSDDDTNDDDVKDIAAKLEVKYGRKTEEFSEKCHAFSFNGYESDSFIDNSEAFDEHIPSDISTLYGGFYINVGPLTFKREQQEINKAYTRVEKYVSLSKPKKELLKELNQKIFTLRKGKLRVENKKVLVRKENEKIKKSKELHENEAKRKPAFPVTSFENMFLLLKKNNEEDSDRSASDLAMSSDSDQHSFLSDKTKLPTDFPSDVANIVENIKNVVSESGSESKMKIRGPLNNLLIKLEYKCRHLDRSVRIKAYDHLAPFVKCQKKWLAKRGKKLWITDRYRNAKELLETFKNTVQGITGSMTQDNKTPKLFIWTDEAKELLKDTMNLQRNCFKLEGKKNKTIETRLVEFVKTDVLPIWPENCMSASELLNYYNSVSDREDKLSYILEQSSSVSDLSASVASSEVTSPNLKIMSDEEEKMFDVNANQDEIIDLTI